MPLKKYLITSLILATCFISLVDDAYSKSISNFSEETFQHIDFQNKSILLEISYAHPNLFDKSQFLESEIQKLKRKPLNKKLYKKIKKLLKKKKRRKRRIIVQRIEQNPYPSKYS